MADQTDMTQISGDVLDDDQENARRLASMDVALATTDATVRPRIRLPKAERRALEAVPSAVRRQCAEKSSVLFDEPGPRARRRIRVLNVVGVAVMLGLLAWLLYALANPPSGQNQLSWKLWEPVPRRQRPALHVPAGPRLHTGRGASWPSPARSRSASLRARPSLALRTAQVAVRGGRRVLPRRARPAVHDLPVALLRRPGLGSVSAFWAVVWGLILYNSLVIAELLRSAWATCRAGRRRPPSRWAWGICRVSCSCCCRRRCAP